MDSNLINNNSSLNIEEKEKIYNNVKNSICKIVINDNKKNYLSIFNYCSYFILFKL